MPTDPTNPPINSIAPSIILRGLKPEDHAFLYATYLRRHWFSKENQTSLRKPIWFALSHARLEKIMKEKPVVLAVLADDRDVILGYTLPNGSERFTYVRRNWRSDFGIEGLLNAVSLTERSSEHNESERSDKEKGSDNT